MKPFIKIQETRIRLSTIKKYKPVNEKNLSIYYSNSRYKVDNEIFVFDDIESMQIIILKLDEYFMCI